MYRQKKMLAMSLLLLFSLNNPAGAAKIGFKPAMNYPVGTAPGATAGISEVKGDRYGFLKAQN